MTEAERLALLRAIDLLVMVARYPAEHNLIMRAAEKLQAAREGLEVEAYAEAAMRPESCDIRPMRPEPFPVVERRAREAGL